MTKRYEKFEEWMIGERVHWEGNSEFEPDSGVVVGMYRDMVDTVYVEWDSDGDKALFNVGKVTFEKGNKVEEQNTAQEIKWEIGQVVFCILRGKGVVSRITDSEDYPLEVDFFDTYDRYTLDGKSYTDHKGRVLFFSEPKIEAELFPPKKPFVPKLKEGDRVLIKDKHGLFGEGTVRVVHKECDDRLYISDEGYYFMKSDIASLRVIGEEIKFEEN